MLGCMVASGSLRSFLRHLVTAVNDFLSYPLRKKQARNRAQRLALRQVRARATIRAGIFNKLRMLCSEANGQLPLYAF